MTLTPDHGNRSAPHGDALLYRPPARLRFHVTEVPLSDELKAAIDEANAHRERMLSVLTPEARARFEDAERNAHALAMDCLLYGCTAIDEQGHRIDPTTLTPPSDALLGRVLADVSALKLRGVRAEVVVLGRDTPAPMTLWGLPVKFDATLEPGEFRLEVTP